MASLWRKSGSFEFDANGEQAAAAQAYFFVGGTTTALTVYQDAALSIPHAIPLVSNGVGRWPAVYIPFIATYDEQILDSAGTQLTYYTAIANVDPTDTATSAIDVTQVYATGDWKFSDVDESKSGFVRANGRTIGNGSSGASERANADCEDLFLYRWNKIANAQAAVSGGRGSSAAADWAANKTIALPDCRGGFPLGLDTMGATAASAFTSVPFTNGSATVAGSLAGLNTHTLTTAQLAVTTPTGTISQITPAGSVSTPAGTISQITPAGTVSKPTITVSGAVFDSQTVTHTTSDVTVIRAGSSTLGITASLDTTPTFTGTPVTPTFTGSASTFTGTPTTPTFTGATFGSGTAHNNVSRAILGSWYVKL